MQFAQERYKKQYELQKRCANNYYLRISRMAFCIRYFSMRKFFMYDYKQNMSIYVFFSLVLSLFDKSVMEN